MIKRLTSLLLVLTVIFCLTISVHAIEAEAPNATTSTSINDTIDNLQSIYPNSIIMEENGVISIIVDAADAPKQSRTQSIYAPRGGTWSNYHPPLEYRLDPNLLQPYGVVFLPADLTEALIESKSSDYIFDFIQEKVEEGLGIDDIEDLLLSKFGADWTYLQVYFVAYNVSKEVYDVLELYGLSKAYSASEDNKISIQFCTSGGWPTNLYYAWEGNYVYDSPWEEFEPDFSVGDYSGLS